MAEKTGGTAQLNTFSKATKRRPEPPEPEYSDIQEFNLNISRGGFWQGANAKIFDELKLAYGDIRMLWERRAPFIGPNVITPAMRLLLHTSMGIACVKLLRPKGRIASARVLAKQKQILRNELLRNVGAINEICSTGQLPSVLSVSHPFVACVNRWKMENREEWLGLIIAKCDDYDYKKSEAIFIRASNNEKKKIKDAMWGCLRENKRLYMLRYDIHPKAELDIAQYRYQLDRVIEGLNIASGKAMALAVDVIHPHAVNYGCFNAPLGQLVVLFKAAKLTSQDPIRLSFIFNAREHEGVDICLLNFFEAFIKGQGGNRFLAVSNPDDATLIDDVAKFLTVERRLMDVVRRADAEGYPVRKPHVLRIKEI